MTRITLRQALALALITTSFGLAACQDGRPDRDDRRHQEHRHGHNGHDRDGNEHGEH